MTTLTDEQCDVIHQSVCKRERGRGVDFMFALIRAGAAFAECRTSVPREPVAWRWRAKGGTVWRFDDGPEWRGTKADDGLEWYPLYAGAAQPAAQDQSGEVANGELGMSSVPGREARDNLSVRANAAAVPTSPDPDDRLLRRRDAMADDVNAWHQAIREAFREDAAEIRRLRAERAEALSSSAHLAKMYDAAVAALRELVDAHGKAGVSGPGPEMKTAVGWALDKARALLKGKP